MIQITPDIAINENEIAFDFVRSSGPGGQNVNKVASAVQLRYDVANASLPEDVKQRLIRLAGSRMTDDGVLILKGQRFRTQMQNREDAQARLIELIGKAAQRPKIRIPTRPTRASQQRRVESKRQRAETKRLRRSGPRAGDEN